MINTPPKSVAAAGLAVIAIAGFSACSATKPTAQPSGTTTKPATSMTATAMGDPAADLVGAGCAAYGAQNPTGPGSVTGMAQDPLATAALYGGNRTTHAMRISGAHPAQAGVTGAVPAVLDRAGGTP